MIYRRAVAQQCMKRLQCARSQWWVGNMLGPNENYLNKGPGFLDPRWDGLHPGSSWSAAPACHAVYASLSCTEVRLGLTPQTAGMAQARWHTQKHPLVLLPGMLFAPANALPVAPTSRSILQHCEPWRITGYCWRRRRHTSHIPRIWNQLPSTPLPAVQLCHCCPLWGHMGLQQH